jgi:hypothetical protein
LKSKKERRRGLKFFVYLRLLRMSVAATAIIAMTATPIAMYVAVGAELVGGMMTGLGVGAIVAVGAWVGTTTAVGA